MPRHRVYAENLFYHNEKTGASTIADRERELLKDIDYEKGYSLYVGIPFCAQAFSILFFLVLS